MGYTMKYPATKCWECKNATGGCSWSQDFTPVCGWNAIPTEIKAVTGKVKMHSSFIVLDCPQYREG